MYQLFQTPDGRGMLILMDKVVAATPHPQRPREVCLFLDGMNDEFTIMGNFAEIVDSLNTPELQK